jgi:chemotaxis signal transduction protein
MATLDTTDMSLTALSESDRLSPTAALSRFRPSANSRLRGKTRQLDQARYGFRVGTLGLLIQERTLSEVIERVAIYPLPNTPGWLLGIINLRGNLLPVFDFKRLFDMTGEESEQGLILVLDKGAQAVGIVIDGLPGTLRGLRAITDMPPIPGALKSHVPAAYLCDSDVWLDLDHRGLFSSLSTRISG